MAFCGGADEDSSAGYLRLRPLLRKIQIRTPVWQCEGRTQCVLNAQHRAGRSEGAQYAPASWGSSGVVMVVVSKTAMAEAGRGAICVFLALLNRDIFRNQRLWGYNEDVSQPSGRT